MPLLSSSLLYYEKENLLYSSDSDYPKHLGRGLYHELRRHGISNDVINTQILGSTCSNNAERARNINKALNELRVNQIEIS